MTALQRCPYCLRHPDGYCPHCGDTGWLVVLAPLCPACGGTRRWERLEGNGVEAVCGECGRRGTFSNLKWEGER